MQSAPSCRDTDIRVETFNPYMTILSLDQAQSTPLSTGIVFIAAYLDMEGEAGAEAGSEEKEDSLRCEGGPPVLQPESGVIRGW